MKLLILSLAMLYCMSSYGQLTQSDDTETVKIGGFGVMGVTIESNLTGSLYWFMYKDMKYTQLNEYAKFTLGNKSSFEELYEIMKSGFVNVPDKDPSFDLPSGSQLTLEHVKAVGVVNIRFVHYEHGVITMSPWITKKKLDRLFGKS